MKARVILRELFGGKINLKREGKGELWAESALHPAALLAVGNRGSGGVILNWKQLIYKDLDLK